MANWYSNCWLPKPWWKCSHLQLYFYITLQIVLCLFLFAIGIKAEEHGNEVFRKKWEAISNHHEQSEIGQVHFQSCKDGCGQQIVDFLKNKTGAINKSGILTVCYPSALTKDGIGNQLKASRRFQFFAEDTICNHCKLMNSSCNGEFNWRGFRFVWKNGTVVNVNSSLDKGTVQIVDQIHAFISSLFDTRKCNFGQKYDLNSQQKDGFFIEDNENLIHKLHLNLALSIHFILNEKAIKKNLRIFWTADPPIPEKIVDNEIKYEKCKELVDKFKKEPGNSVSFSKKECLLMFQIEEHGTGFDPNSSRAKLNGSNQAWDSHNNIGPLEHKEPDDVEKEIRETNWTSSTKVMVPIEEEDGKRQKRSAEEECDDKRFDVRLKWPECNKVISYIRDQTGCLICWAISAAAALTDRACISEAEVRHKSSTMLKCNGTDCEKDDMEFMGRVASVRDLMECINNTNRGCKEGDPLDAWKYYFYEGSVNEYCKPYAFNKKLNARPDWGQKCFARCDNAYGGTGSLDLLKWCDNLDMIGHYKKEKTPNDWRGIKEVYSSLYRVFLYRYLLGENWEDAMVKELTADGTIVACFDLCNDFYMKDEGVIYKKKDTATCGVGHCVRLIGYGVVNCPSGKSEKYWLAADSYGPEAKNSIFKIRRGTNECKIESSAVSWGKVLFPFPKNGTGKIGY